MKRHDWLKLSLPVVFSLVVAGVLGLGWAVVYLPQRQTESLRKGVEDYRSSLPKPDPEKLATLEKGRIDSENAIRTGLIQGIGGTVLLVGLYFTYQNLKATQRNVRIAEDKQVTERFSKAVDMLSSASMHTRLGGIYALERIANDSDKDYPQVMEVLCAFVREESPWPPKDSDWVKEPEALKTGESVTTPQACAQANWEVRQRLRAAIPALRTDIQAVITVIGRRKYRDGAGSWETRRLDLSKTDLRKLKAYKANLTGVDLFKAHLEGANLKGADLFETILKGADLSQVTHLTQEQLNEAHTNNDTILPYYLLPNEPTTPSTKLPTASAESSQPPPEPSAEFQPPES